MKKRKVKKRIPKLRRINNGYVQINVSMKWIFEHRLIMENKLGRCLNEEESIHHLNRNRKDNRIENLMLFPSHKEHIKYEKEKIFKR